MKKEKKKMIMKGGLELGVALRPYENDKNTLNLF